MKIVYLANHRNNDSDDTEGHIARALVELGHEVVRVSDPDNLPDGDVCLFHKIIPNNFSGKKVCWYFDRVWRLRVAFMEQVLDQADIVFVTDETWAKERNHPKLRILRQGIGDAVPGEQIDVSAKIAFVGSLYEDRYAWAVKLQEAFGGDFQMFTRVFNRDLNNLCATVPIFVAPSYPSDNFYWSNRVYLIMGSGGFLIHPRLKGLMQEYSDSELVMYDSDVDLIEKIKYYLAHPEERERIRLAGWNKTREQYTYKKRIEQLLTLV